MKYLIAGLGNIGDEYAHTRHNIGFDVLDELIKDQNVKFKSDRLADVCEIKYKGRILVLIKPTTFMNLSGKAVQYWLNAEKIPVENLLVIMDDLALPVGTLRLRPGGSDAGHNGLKNINPKGHQADFVLQPFKKEEQTILPERIKLACDIVKSFTSIGLQHTMNQFNNK
jgi:PTH1 family peptidyl-tRNA hydrolase